MKIKILGSGGCRALPRPTCDCNICREARLQGEPYKRTGCSIFLEDEKLLIDTSEDIVYQLNRENIVSVENIMFSHWDPDHTMGMRVIEQLHDSSWLRTGAKNPINIMGLSGVEAEIRAIKNMFGSYFDYYEGKKLCKFSVGERFKVGELEIKLYEVKSDITATVFCFEKNDKKVIYAPCDIKPIPYDDGLRDADLLIIGAFYPDSFKTNDKIFGTDTVLYSELHTGSEILKIKKDLGIKRVIVTHLEEEWKLSYDDYKRLEKEYNDELEFAFDGMEIEL